MQVKDTTMDMINMFGHVNPNQFNLTVIAIRNKVRQENGQGPKWMTRKIKKRELSNNLKFQYGTIRTVPILCYSELGNQ